MRYGTPIVARDVKPGDTLLSYGYEYVVASVEHYTKDRMGITLQVTPTVATLCQVSTKQALRLVVKDGE
jgi:hypothetical protein